MQLVNNLDVGGNEIQNVRAQSLPAFPSSPAEGQFFFYTGVSPGVLYYHNGTGWIRADGQDAALSYGAVTAETTYGQASSNGAAATVARSDHTHGTPPLPSLDALAAQGGDYSAAGYKITSLGTPTAGTDAVTKAYADALRQGMDPKDSVVAASTGNVSVTAYAGTTMDGVALTAGDRVLLKNQTAPAENGIRIYNGNGAALTRATDADASGEISVGTFTFVESGTTNGGQRWLVTATGASPWVPGTTSSTWTQDSGAAAVTAGAGLVQNGNAFDVVGTAGRILVAADSINLDPAYVASLAQGGTGATDAAGARTALAAAGKYAVDVGDGAATSYVLTHNLGTRDVACALRSNTTPWAFKEPDWEATSTNTVTVRFSVAPTAAQYRAIIVG